MLQYNENGDLQEYQEFEHIVKCKNCKKPYLQEITEQVPGFRDMSEDVCPYCQHLNGTSMDVEYQNFKLERRC